MQHKQININQELIDLCLEGNERALYQMYHLTYGALSAVCKRYLNDHDEISLLLNTGFLKIVKGLKKYQSNIPFEAWIKRIMINTVIDHHRKNKKYRELIHYADHLPEPKFSQVNFNKADEIFDAQQLLELIHRLPPISGKVFNLAAIDGYSHREIAEMLGISEGTSKWHLSNARKKLQEMMASKILSKKKKPTSRLGII